MGRSGFTLVELLIVIVVLCVLAALLVPATNKAREGRRYATCQNNLKQLGLVFKMYASESIGERYPRSRRGLAGIDGPALFPEYITDDSILLCPSDKNAVKSYASGGPDNVGFWYRLDAQGERYCDPDRFASLSYIYLAWVTTRPEELENVARIQKEAGVTFDAYEGERIDRIKDSDLDVTKEPGGLGSGTGNRGMGADTQDGNTIFRIRVGIGRALTAGDMIALATSRFAEYSLPVMMDSPGPGANTFGHAPAGTNLLGVGANVLYMDGHVSYTRYPREYPVSTGAMDVLKQYKF
ncbi:MAG: type II secretion system protein [Candidatus Hydrogenedentales bacterium]